MGEMKKLNAHIMDGTARGRDVWVLVVRLLFSQLTGRWKINANGSVSGLG